jgi:hypothetical protein
MCRADVENIALSLHARKGLSAFPRPLTPSLPANKKSLREKAEAGTNGNRVKRPEPLVGFEPTTARLRIECSTPELQWQRTSRMPWRGFEPRRLSAPPPQDGVSTSFTTRAKTTGPTGLEPATSRVTVECSNQTELRPLARIRARVAHSTATESDLLHHPPRVTAAVNRRAHSRTHALTVLPTHAVPPIGRVPTS